MVNNCQELGFFNSYFIAVLYTILLRLLKKHFAEYYFHYNNLEAFEFSLLNIHSKFSYYIQIKYTITEKMSISQKP